LITVEECSHTLPGLAYENEGHAGHDQGAGADERHASVLDLARAGAAADLPEAVDASSAKAAAKGVERQFAVELDTPVLMKSSASPSLQKPKDWRP